MDERVSLAPPQAAAMCRHAVIAGSEASSAADWLENDRKALDVLPDARQAILLPERDLTANLAPIYGRPPDARLPGAAR